MHFAFGFLCHESAVMTNMNWFVLLISCLGPVASSLQSLYPGLWGNLQTKRAKPCFSNLGSRVIKKQSGKQVVKNIIGAVCPVGLKGKPPCNFRGNEISPE